MGYSRHETVKADALQRLNELVTLGTYSHEMIGPQPVLVNSATPVAQSWPVANKAYFVPFEIARPVMVPSLWAFNGVTVAGNVDMGLYRENGALIVSKGSTAQAAQVLRLDITDTLLPGPARYYVAVACDTAGATNLMIGTNPGSTGLVASTGVCEQATAFPLASNANPATFARITDGFIPFIGINVRAFE